MIFLKAYRHLKTPTGKVKRYKMRNLEVTWNNDFNEFDIYDPNAWGNYLANEFRLPSGGKLPDYTREKEKIAYLVKAVGISKEMMEATGKIGQVSLFPGYHLSGENKGQVRDLSKYGVLKRWRK